MPSSELARILTFLGCAGNNWLLLRINLIANYSANLFPPVPSKQYRVQPLRLGTIRCSPVFQPPPFSSDAVNPPFVRVRYVSFVCLVDIANSPSCRLFTRCRETPGFFVRSVFAGGLRSRKLCTCSRDKPKNRQSRPHPGSALHFQESREWKVESRCFPGQLLLVVASGSEPEVRWFDSNPRNWFCLGLVTEVIRLDEGPVSKTGGGHTLVSSSLTTSASQSTLYFPLSTLSALCWDRKVESGK